MNLKTITFDADSYQLVPKTATELTWLSLDFATHWMPLPVFDGGQ